MAAAIAGGWLLVRANTARRLRRLDAVRSGSSWDRLAVQPDGRPAVVAFSTASCADCRVQDRQLRLLAGARVISVDAAERGDVAAWFGVLTVPATVVLRADGSVAAVNNGLAAADRLRSQLGSWQPERGAESAL